MRDRQRRHEREILVDGVDPERPRVVDGAERHLLAVDEDPAPVGPQEAGQDLDQRRLAGAVVADEAEHLALGQVHRDVDERRDRAEALRDVLDADRVRRGAVPLSRHCSLPRFRRRATWTFTIIDGEDRQAGDQVEREGADADDVEAGAQDDQHGDADEAPIDGADAAEQRRAADDRAGDGQEHQVRAALQRHDRRDRGSSRGCPAKPASKFASTKLPILIQRTLTPLSAAPMRLPPVATVHRPQRVQVRIDLHERARARAPRRTRS